MPKPITIHDNQGKLWIFNEEEITGVYFDNTKSITSGVIQIHELEITVSIEELKAFKRLTEDIPL